MTNTNDGSSNVVEINSEQAFTPDPMYKLMGVFEDPDSGSAAVDELAASGFAKEDIELLCGVPGAETYDFSGEDHGIGAMLMRRFRNITFDRVIMARYEQALHDGHCVLMVHIHKTPRRGEAADILNRNGAVQVDYFGLAMTKAFPDDPNVQEEKYDPDARY